MDYIELAQKLWDKFDKAKPTLDGEDASRFEAHLSREIAPSNGWVHWASSSNGDQVHALAYNYVHKHAKVQGSSSLASLYTDVPLIIFRYTTYVQYEDMNVLIHKQGAYYSNGAVEQIMCRTFFGDVPATRLWMDETTRKAFNYPMPS